MELAPRRRARTITGGWGGLDGGDAVVAVELKAVAGAVRLDDPIANHILRNENGQDGGWSHLAEPGHAVSL